MRLYKSYFSLLIVLLYIVSCNCKEQKSNLAENSMSEHKFTNKLIEATSPYLLQHAHNPVNWYPWDAKALELARKQDKLIFLSIGYSACHWCHVMERESFENEAIAQILNDNFICIKVDREERPDLDEIYMNAVQMMAGSGGWPLSVWLTPDLEPFFGGTYFPPEDRWGRIGFNNILKRIINLWENQREQLLQSAGQITSLMNRINQVQSSDFEFNLSLWRSAVKTAGQNFDKRYGGFGSAPKFPQAMELSFLLRYYFHTGEKQALNMVEKSLQEMAKGGILDQLGGGFHRYSTDEKWLVPHFEKMLYDNALLSVTYLEAYQITRREFYAEVARATLDYVLREMTATEGGFYSSQDADSQGEEGKFYVWQKNEIDKILSRDESKLFCTIYGMSPDGNWEGKNILFRYRNLQNEAQKLGLTEYEIKDRLEQSRQKLLKVRAERIPPHKDDKIVTSWNGLMISAMCKGFQVLIDKKYLVAAQKSVDFLLKKLYFHNQIFRTYRNGTSHLNGYLSDYAFLVAALIDVYESSFELSYLRHALEINDLTLHKFWDDKQGGFFFTSSDHEKLLIRTRNLYDNPIPSGNSIAVSNLLRLSEFTGNQSFKEKAEQTVKLYAAQVEKSPTGFAVLLSVLDFFWGKPKEIVVTGDRNSAAFTDIVTVIYNSYLPNKILAYADPSFSRDNKKLIEILPVIDGKITTDGTANIFVCENFTCKSPFTTIDQYKDYYNALLKE